MGHCIFYALMFALFISFGVGAMNYSSVNRTFLTMYKGVFEASVSSLDKNAKDIKPYFNKNKLEEYVTKYLEDNLTKYVTSYQASIYYFNKSDDTLCTSQYCRAVRITLKTDINYFFHYEKAKNIYINSKDEI